mmetsp:Transcript_203/g.308  ORF Transcript_203/g.308 Transcript_203/m.308 type:complete len:639 (+) Transcript_203:126-2042(+)|eukprot:CAMPEP_0184870774 /NCGR_PEP_ID=MMETSP0580-20130426/38729_1 /TAXON_ID=1118495 /ORGANISM="Dactyliosolen fragilissimus" /LENGTH=638 /DNA_ID=CAMNT_0027373049 /DNA_START=38 /DNA_END=1954 /DNA_ORIENTATION=+
MNILTCTLSGETPIDAVITPSGYVYSKRLLLSKLTENGNIDPMTSQPLDESQLIELKLTTGGKEGHHSAVQPPRLPESSSFPALLDSMRSAYDSLILELFDVRRALVDTRRELSDALYRNDAAVRVIARLSMERDAAREEVTKILSSNNTTTTNTNEMDKENLTNNNQHDNVAKKRKIDNEDADDVASTTTTTTNNKPRPNVVEADNMEVDQDENNNNVSTIHVPPQTIPDDCLSAMTEKWKALSSNRRSARKAKSSPSSNNNSTILTLEALKSWTEIESSFSKEITPTTTDIEHAAMSDTLIATLSKSGTLHISTNGQEETIATHTNLPCRKDNVITFSSISHQNKDDNDDVPTPAFAWCENVKGGENLQLLSGSKLEYSQKLPCPSPLSKVVALNIHPTGEHLLATTTDKKLHFFHAKNQDAIREVACFGGSAVDASVVDPSSSSSLKESSYTTANLHPDGLILAAGETNGNVDIWDLKTQKLASTLKSKLHKPVSSIAFSENGYHIGIAIANSVSVWDLRKQKIVSSLPTTLPHNTKCYNCLAFDKSGKFLACGSDEGAIVVFPIKNPECTVILNDDTNDSNTGQGPVKALGWNVITSSSKNDDDGDDNSSGFGVLRLISFGHGDNSMKSWGKPL